MTEGLKAITAGELMDTQLIPKFQIVDGFLPVGTYILAGAPKVGKSFLMTQLCWCIAEGVPFLGYDTKQMDVLYLALEDTDVRVQDRLSRMFGVDWTGNRLYLSFQASYQGNALLQELSDFVLTHPDTRLIVIDTLQRVRGSDGGHYSYANDYNDISPFKSFSDAHDLAVILVHHTRKNVDSANPFDQISGTNGLLGAADGAFVLHKEKERTLLDFTGRDLPQQQYVLRFVTSNCRWELVQVGSDVSECDPAPLLDWIDAVVQERWDGTAEELLQRIHEIAPESGLKANTLSRELNRLTARLESEKHIRYRKVKRSGSRRGMTMERFVLNDDSDDNSGTGY